MRRGTHVGEAWVSLTVDGDGINEEIVDEVDGAGPGVEKAGEDHGDRYSEGFFSRIREKIASRLNDENGSIFRGSGASDAGDSAGESYSQRFFGAMEKRFGEGRLHGAVEALLGGGAGGSGGGSDVGDRAGRNFADDFLDSLENRLRDGEGELNQLFERLVSGNGSSGGRNKNTLGDTIGGFLGAGSRNNVLNLFGRSLGNIIDLTEKARSTAVGLFSSFKQGFSEAEEGANLLQKVMSGFSGSGSAIGEGLSSVFASLAESGPAVVVAIAVVIVAISALVSVATALAAILTAIVATITSALVGALAVAGAGLLALVAAGGLAVAMFTSLTDAQKAALKADFAPVKNELIGLGQIMLSQVAPAFKTWSDNLQRALYLLAPLADTVGQAFARAGTLITASLGGPGVQAFTTALGIYLPQIITSLSLAFGNFLNGALAVFAVILPYVLQFSNTLATLALKFDNFANSTAGHNAIVDFVDRAVTSLDSLWNATRQIFGFIFDLLFNPTVQGAGNTIFDGIASTFESLRQKLAQASADGSLQKFFDDAIRFGGQLWEAIKGLIAIFVAFYDSGILADVGNALEGFGRVMEKIAPVVGGIVSILDALVNPIGTVASAFKSLPGPVGSAIDWISSKLGVSARDTDTWAAHVNRAISVAMSSAAFASQFSAAAAAGSGTLPHVPTLEEIIKGGQTAASQTNIPTIKTPKAPPKYKNPYVKYANSLIKDTNTTRDQINAALVSMNTTASKAVTDALASTGGGKSVADALQDTVQGLQDSGKSTVSAAQQALNSAAQSLASASSKKAAKAALKAVHAAQADMTAAIAAQNKLNAASGIIFAQEFVDANKVANLVAGLGGTNITLAEFAEARAQLAVKIADANQKLTDAIALRDDFKNAVIDNANAFGALTTAQAQTLNGIQQSLTASDITSNLQDKLDKIKSFQQNLLLLRSQGLSDSAYKQIVDAGVDGGSAYAQALVDGGIGSIQQTNDLVDQIDKTANLLGTQASDSLYQAGVAAAQGLVDGLTSLSAQLDAAAASLGAAIAAQIKQTLGIASPSKVMFTMMGSVGDGLTLGLAAQKASVVAATKQLSNAITDNIMTTPQGAVAATQPVTAPVSGNGARATDPAALFGDLHIHTPTEDPRAVAVETVNDLVGRL